TGNFPSGFGEPLASLLYPRPSLTLVSAYELGAYLTVFLFPFFLLERWRAIRWRRFALVAVMLVAAIAVGRGGQGRRQSFHHQADFPFAANVVYDTGVGPITLTTTYWDARAPRPRWPRGVWSAVEWLAVAGLVLWARFGAGVASGVRLTPLAAEI